MWPVIGGLIAGAGSLIGGAIGSSSNEEINEQNLAWAREQQAKNEELQRQFAQSGIQWKVNDAKAAGIHPLAALGANTISYSPSVIGSPSSPDTSMGEGVSRMGQDIGRAISATADEDTRTINKLQIASLREDIIGKQLQNSIIAKQSFVGPPMPTANEANFIPGQGNPGKLVNVQPAKRTISQPGRLAQEAGWRPDVSYSRTDTGLTPVIPESLSESMEDDVIGKTMWRIRNQLMPNFTGSGKPPTSQLPKGYKDWDWDGAAQEWRPVKGFGSYPLQRIYRQLIGR